MLWTAGAYEGMVRDQLRNTTYILNGTVETLLRSEVRAYLRRRAEAGAEILRWAYREHAGDTVARGAAVGRAVDALRAGKVGNSGYYYAVNLSGTAVFHPDSALVQTSLPGRWPLARLVATRGGYLEYREQDGGTPGLWALFTTSIPELGWLLTAAAPMAEMAGLVDLDGLHQAINAAASGRGGYSY
ncbi:MAG TPA: cache domain-containing protein, partial [Magnetospirillaceae bacterium]|nr:cache domain-containing protein [Magnetospirillaceae bacterium]